jgi:hypothetical protein
VRKAKQRAAATGELRPPSKGSAQSPLSAEVSTLIREIIADGTYEKEIIRIGKEDPDLASA